MLYNRGSAQIDYFPKETKFIHNLEDSITKSLDNKSYIKVTNLHQHGAHSGCLIFEKNNDSLLIATYYSVIRKYKISFIINKSFDYYIQNLHPIQIYLDSLSNSCNCMQIVDASRIKVELINFSNIINKCFTISLTCIPLYSSNYKEEFLNFILQYSISAYNITISNPHFIRK